MLEPLNEIVQRIALAEQRDDTEGLQDWLMMQTWIDDSFDSWVKPTAAISRTAIRRMTWCRGGWSSAASAWICLRSMLRC